MILNDYIKATEIADGLFAVQLSDNGWSIADGPGTRFTAPDDEGLAGYHLPVKFETEGEAVAAIHSGPDVMFDIQPDCEWAKHCVAHGAVPCEAYLLA